METNDAPSLPPELDENANNCDERFGAGYIRLWRKLSENPIWTTLQPSVLKVMLGFLLKANWKSTTWYDGQTQVQIPRGAFITSYPKMAEFCHLSTKQVRRAFAHLNKLQFAAYTRAGKWTMVSVLNYETHQRSSGEAGDGTLRAGLGQSEGTLRASAKELKNTRSNKRSPDLDRANGLFSVDNPPFDTLDETPAPDAWGPAEKKRVFHKEFWSMWPRKVARAAAEKAWCKEATSPEQAEKIISAVHAQLHQLTADLTYCPHASTWLNQKRYDDEVEEKQNSVSHSGSLYTPAEDAE